MIPYLSLIKTGVVVASILLLGYLGYDKIYTAGYSKAENMYKEQIEQTNLRLEKSKVEIEILSDLIENSRVSEVKQLQESLDSYLAAFRKGQRPTTIISPSGECRPSPEFVMAVNEFIRKANASSATASNPTK